MDEFMGRRGVYAEIVLKSGREASLRWGHPWVFSGAVERIDGDPSDGDIVLAKDAGGRALGLGFFNRKTDIAFRLLTRDCHRVIDAEFWRHRIHEAMTLRRRVISSQTDAYRLINAEGDGCPGLIVDVYRDTLAISITTAGMEKQRSSILDVLINTGRPASIYEQSVGRSRRLEGLEERKETVYGPSPESPVRISENGFVFDVDVKNGQKTGFFLDQRVNREKVGRLSRGAAVLNCFCYTGAFSVYCAAGGARKVVSLDISKSAIAQAAHHLSQNGFSPQEHPVLDADVFDYVRDVPDRFDIIILDPPAFAKTKRDVDRATRGYKEINLQALRHLPSGGLLATFSCSNFIDEALFDRVVAGAARDAQAEVQLLSRLEAGPDHPQALGHPEGRYLKGLLLRKR